jgi:hypothetical protein
MQQVGCHAIALILGINVCPAGKQLRSIMYVDKQSVEAPAQRI